MSVYSVGGTAAGVPGSASSAGTPRKTPGPDTEAAGGMSLGDFQSLAAALGLNQTQAAQDFKLWDTDGNGVLSNDELLKGLVGKSGSPSPLCQQFIRAIDGMKDLSLDSDGSVKPGATTPAVNAGSASPPAASSSEGPANSR